MSIKVPFLVVGSGLAGSVIAERIANVLKKEVLVIERREHIGGNVYDFVDKNKIIIHKYGPHAFHTNSKEVWNYLSQFTRWHPYFHKVLGVVEGIKVPLPFNLNSIYQVFPTRIAELLEQKLISKFGYGKKVFILDLIQEYDEDLKFLANYVYERVYLGYTKKQWGLTPEQLDKSVTSRVPIYVSRDNRYFQDEYQGIPMEGYTKMVSNILDNKKIKIEINTDFFKVKDKIKYDYLIYTGPIDEFFNFKYGNLPYRSLRFDYVVYQTKYFQEVAQVNYPENYEFTRITEFKHFLIHKDNNSTVVAFEYPQEYIREVNEPYYPIPKQETAEVYKKYKEIADSLKDTIFVGRLADYKYYNMDQIVARALKVFDEKLSK